MARMGSVGVTLSGVRLLAERPLVGARRVEPGQVDLDVTVVGTE